MKQFQLVLPKALFLFSLLYSREACAECPWDPMAAHQVAGGFSFIMVDGHKWKVQGTENRLEFVEILYACGEDEAVVPFLLWRSTRRSSNIAWGATLGTGMTLLGFFVIPIPATAAIIYSVAAKKQREQVERLLEEPVWE